MGYFENAFDIGAGATLGNLAVQTGYNLTLGAVNSADKKVYNQYRSRNFDPIVRQDLKDIMVKGMLQNIACPFPTSVQENRPNFFARHKVFTGCLCIGLACDLLSRIIPFWIFSQISSMAYVVMAGSIFGMAMSKLGKGAKTLVGNSKAIKNRLIQDGKQYWYVREYVRQALEIGEMDAREAIVKISNTSLACQFPDTIEEIEANAFYYRKELGM